MGIMKYLLSKLFNLYTALYMLYMTYLKPGEMMERYSPILHEIDGCSKCNELEEVSSDKPVEEYMCNEHLEKVSEGEIGDPLFMEER